MIQALARRASATTKTWKTQPSPNSSKSTVTCPNAFNSVSSSARCSGQHQKNHGIFESIYRSIMLNSVKTKENSWRTISQGFCASVAFFFKQEQRFVLGFKECEYVVRCEMVFAEARQVSCLDKEYHRGDYLYLGRPYVPGH